MAYYFGDALAELKKIKGTTDGHLDIDSLPEFAQRDTVSFVKIPPEKEGEKPTYTQKVVSGRDLGAMVSILTVAVQQLTERLEKIEAGQK